VPAIQPNIKPLPIANPLKAPVSTLSGVGRERTEQFRRLGISTIEDLLLHRPRRYEDRRRLRNISDVQVGETVICRGVVVDLGVKWFARHTRSVFDLVLDDGSGRLHCRWWNQPYLEKSFSKGQEVVVFGKVKSLKPRAIDHPETEAGDIDGDAAMHVGRIVPVHPLTEGMSARWMRAQVWRALEEFAPLLPDEPGPLLDEGLSLLPFLQVSRKDAVRFLHFPETLDQPELARKRLAFDEFFDLQKAIRERRVRFETKATALPCSGDNTLIKPFLKRLGFKLTEWQLAVLKEIRADISGAHPMRRLLQGDVGSGKTVVAACCALMSLESGYDVAVMAPTEILAGQHFNTFDQWLAPIGVRVDIITGSSKPSSAATSPSLTIGTHALIESGYSPRKLGLVVIDEQHRFGVAQRERLVRKGSFPHLLVMTATPIPRTLGLTLYGELDISVLAGSPPGRGAVRTFIRTADKLPQVWEFIRSRLATGSQAYVICPRVDADELGVKAVTTEFEKIRSLVKPYTAGMIHGRLSSAEKTAIMDEFRANKIHVLLATSLIEVGVDVPNATTMLIENADQFGLAQLHQLRGRIGRGTSESWCILMDSSKTPESKARLDVLEKTSDGFKIAEADLQLRGPGELLGKEQSGLPNFRFGDLTTDIELIHLARKLAARVAQFKVTDTNYIRQSKQLNHR
jgi:ATP-dependent DNA helicase RecG